MKTKYLYQTVIFAAFLFFGMYSANAQQKKETRIVIIDGDTVQNTTTYAPKNKGVNTDSLQKSMNQLGDEMRKAVDEIRRSVKEAFDEEKMQQLEDKLTEMANEMEKMGKELEENLSDLNLDSDAETGEMPENTEIPEAPEEDEAGVQNNKDKTIAITDDGIFINVGKKKGKKNKEEDWKNKVGNSATDWFLLDLGINTFMSQNSFDLPATADPLELNLPKSVNVTLHLFRTGVNIYKHNVYTTFGLAYDMHDYRLTKNTTLLKDTNRFAFADAGTKLSKNKLSVQYITLPVMLHFETNPLKPGRSFKLGFGGWGGLLANSYIKQKSEERGKQHLHDDYNLNTLNYGLRGQIGYGMFTFYSQYALSPLFKSKVGAPELNPITFGIILNGFTWN